MSSKHQMIFLGLILLAFSLWFGLAANVAVEREKTKRAEIECGGN